MAAEFEKLLEELDVMAKSQTAASEEEAAKAKDLADGDDKKDVTTTTTTPGDGKELRKSLAVTDANGNVVEVEDAGELLKALNGRFDDTQGQIAKVFDGFIALAKSQGAQIKALQEQVATISNQGRGRKAVLSLVTKQPLAKSASGESAAGGEHSEITSEGFMAKAMTAQKAGRLTAVQISMVESCLHRSMEIPQEIVNAVLHQ